MATNFHAFFSYVLLGYMFILPLMLITLKLFKIKNPKHKMEFYILSLIMPILGIAVFYNILSKRCQLGFDHGGLFNRIYESLCILGLYASRFLTPLLIAVVFLAVLKALFGYIYLKNLRKHSVLPPDDQIKRINSILAKRCEGWNFKTPNVLYSQRIDVAASVIGVLNPTIVLGYHLLNKLTDKELDMVLTHELVHIKNSDLNTGSVLNLARDLMFFNPISTWLLKGYMIERERLCDEETANLVGDSRLYAKTLLKVWTILVENKEKFSVASLNFVSNNKQMEYRITSLLTEGKNCFSHRYLTIIKVAFSVVSVFILWIIC